MRTRLAAPEGAVEDDAGELWTGGFALPVEPRPPSRTGGTAVVIGTVVLLAALALGIWFVIQDQVAFDPGVDDAPVPTQPADPTEPADGEA